MKYEVTLYLPNGLRLQYNDCTLVDTDNLVGGIAFTTASGDYYRSTLQYTVRPELKKN